MENEKADPSTMGAFNQILPLSSELMRNETQDTLAKGKQTIHPSSSFIRDYNIQEGNLKDKAARQEGEYDSNVNDHILTLGQLSLSLQIHLSQAPNWK